jgi:hypothetical protein
MLPASEGHFERSRLINFVAVRVVYIKNVASDRSIRYAPCTQSTRPVNYTYVATESRTVATVWHKPMREKGCNRVENSDRLPQLSLPTHG